MKQSLASQIFFVKNSHVTFIDIKLSRTEQMMKEKARSPGRTGTELIIYISSLHLIRPDLTQGWLPGTPSHGDQPWFGGVFWFVCVCLVSILRVGGLPLFNFYPSCHNPPCSCLWCSAPWCSRIQERHKPSSVISCYSWSGQDAELEKIVTVDRQRK